MFLPYLTWVWILYNPIQPNLLLSMFKLSSHLSWLGGLVFLSIYFDLFVFDRCEGFLQLEPHHMPRPGDNTCRRGLSAATAEGPTKHHGGPESEDSAKILLASCLTLAAGWVPKTDWPGEETTCRSSGATGGWKAKQRDATGALLGSLESQASSWNSKTAAKALGWRWLRWLEAKNADRTIENQRYHPPVNSQKSDLCGDGGKPAGWNWR